MYYWSSVRRRIIVNRDARNLWGLATVVMQTQAENSEDVSSEDRRKIDAQLERLLVHPLFRQSKRLPAFLRYVVQESLAHGSDGPPKERTLGIAVFGRKPDYDTATDPVVRVTATELRKKLAQYYYEEGHLDEIRIELPPGSYLPKFRRSSSQAEVPDPHLDQTPVPVAEVVDIRTSEPATPEHAHEADPVPATTGRGWRLLAATLAVLLIAALAGYIPLLNAAKPNSLGQFWSNFAGKSSQVLIVMPVIEHPSSAPSAPSSVSVAGNLSIEDTNIAARVAAQLQMRNANYRLVSAPELNFGNLRGVPAVLIGALDNVWTMRLVQKLPFTFGESPDGRTGRILDTQDPSRSWSIDITTPHAHITKDYGIIARYRDQMTGEPILILAGISSQGTQAAGETVTNPEYMDAILANTLKTSANVEIIVETEAIDGRSGPPRVVASRTW